MNRSDHLQWCKDRANEYLDRGNVSEGVASMISDMGKHEETDLNSTLVMLGMMTVASNDLAGAKRFVDGFN